MLSCSPIFNRYPIYSLKMLHVIRDHYHIIINR